MAGDGDIYCVYVLIGADDRRLARARQAIEEAGRLSSSVIVSAPAADTDIMRCIAPYTGCAIAEYFRDRGSDALIVFDDIGAHAHALTNLAKFANHQDTQFGLMRRLSRLLDRSAQLSPEKGGGPYLPSRSLIHCLSWKAGWLMSATLSPSGLWTVLRASRTNASSLAPILSWKWGSLPSRLLTCTRCPPRRRSPGRYGGCPDALWNSHAGAPGSRYDAADGIFGLDPLEEGRDEDLRLVHLRKKIQALLMSSNHGHQFTPEEEESFFAPGRVQDHRRVIS